MKEKNYNYFEKLIHKIILKNNFIIKNFFNLEKLLFLDKKIIPKAIFITGLPRSGSTSLLNSFFESSKFGSLTYEDMPFILSPNLWNKVNIFSKKEKKYFERYHQDGIFFNSKSPEAFEEVFWMNLLDKIYIKDKILNYHNVDDDVLDEFKKFMQIVIKSKKSEFYLSKNNNNILRVEDLSNKLNNSNFFIIFRDPLNQSFSMQKQYYNFIKLQEKDDFIEEYMSMIGHFEFGKGYKEIFHKKDFNINEKEKLGYWLQIWKQTYENLYKKLKTKDNIYFLSYEELSKNKKKYLEQKGIDKNITDAINLDNFNNKNKMLETENSKILQEAKELYNKMVNNL